MHTNHYYNTHATDINAPCKRLSLYKSSLMFFWLLAAEHCTHALLLAKRLINYIALTNDLWLLAAPKGLLRNIVVWLLAIK